MNEMRLHLHLRKCFQAIMLVLIVLFSSFHYAQNKEGKDTQGNFLQRVNSALTFYYADKYDSAFFVFESLANKTIYKDSLGDYLDYFAYTYHYIGRKAEAKKTYYSFLKHIIKKPFGKKQYKRIYNVSLDYAFILFEEGNYPYATTILDNLKNLVELHPSYFSIKQGLLIEYYLGYMYFLNTEFALAEMYFKKLLDNNNAESSIVFASFFDLGLSYLYCDRISDAYKQFEKCIAFDKMYYSSKTQIQGYKAVCLWKLGKLREAQLIFNNISKKNEFINDSELRLWYSDFLYATDKSAFAKNSNLLFELIEKRTSKTGQSGLYLLYGDYWILKCDSINAMLCYQRSLEILSGVNTYKLLQMNDIVKCPSKRYLMFSIQRIIILLNKQGSSQHHEIEGKEIIRLTDFVYYLESKLLDTFSMRESQLFLACDYAHIPVYAMNICLEIYDKTHNKLYLDKAIKYSEWHKSQVLSTYEKRLNAMHIAGISSTLIECDAVLEKEILKLERKLERLKTMKNTGKDENLFSSSLLKLYLLRKDFRKYLEQQYPVFNEAKSNNNRIHIPTLQHMLDTDKAAISYTFGDSCLFITYLDKNNFEIVKTQARNGFNDTLRHFIRLLSDAPTATMAGNRLNDFACTSFYLYNRLLKPFEKLLQSKKQLLISPDGDLNYISFDALISRMPSKIELKQNDFCSLNYLINKFAFSYCYSLTLYMSRAATTQSPNDAFVLFVPTYNSTSATSAEHGELKGALDEATQLNKIWNSTLFEGPEATTTSFIKQAPQVGILHIAAHSLYDSINPMMSKLLFSSEKTDTSGVTLYDIYGMNFKNELVVLSTCESGRGKTYKGEGVFSIARALFRSGCSSIIVPLWPVDDKINSEILRYFYQYLSDGYTKDIALQKAKLYFLKNTNSTALTHPFYWSPPIVIGNTNRVELHAKSRYSVALTSTLCLGALVLVLVVRRRIKSVKKGMKFDRKTQKKGERK